MDGAPHCRDAPWGVSEAAPTIQEEEGRSDARWRRSDLKTPGRPRTPWDFWGEIAAAETPHGASLQWGAPAVETVKLTPIPAQGYWRALIEEDLHATKRLCAACSRTASACSRETPGNHSRSSSTLA